MLGSRPGPVRVRYSGINAGRGWISGGNFLRLIQSDEAVDVYARVSRGASDDDLDGVGPR